MVEKMIEKTDGNGNTFMVENPDLYNDEGKRVKYRHKPTNFTPKKKKRNKHNK